MITYTADDVMEAVVRVIPNPNQLRDIDSKTDKNGVIFSWIGTTVKVLYRVDNKNIVDVCCINDGLTIKNNISILFEALLKPELIRICIRNKTKTKK